MTKGGCADGAENPGGGALALPGHGIPDLAAYLDNVRRLRECVQRWRIMVFLRRRQRHPNGCKGPPPMLSHDAWLDMMD